MKEAIKSIEEKGIKTSDLEELSARGIKLPIDEPCFPIQVHAIAPSKGNKKVPPPINVSYSDYTMLLTNMRILIIFKGLLQIGRAHV